MVVLKKRLQTFLKVLSVYKIETRNFKKIILLSLDGFVQSSSN
jgi:hypothetical protein